MPGQPSTFLGLFPFPPILQAIGLVVVFAVPFAILSVIPAWILSDIAEHSAVTTGDATTGVLRRPHLPRSCHRPLASWCSPSLPPLAAMLATISLHPALRAGRCRALQRPPCFFDDTTKTAEAELAGLVPVGPTDGLAEQPTT
ncbi:MAG: hypothetical protein R2706_12470 [Acidimicrobiales bacterium]